MPEETDKTIAKLERQIRILQRKLERSEENRAQVEETKDRFDVLYQSVIAELDEQKALLKKKNDELQKTQNKLSDALTLTQLILESAGEGFSELESMQILKLVSSILQLPRCLAMARRNWLDVLFAPSFKHLQSTPRRGRILFRKP